MTAALKWQTALVVGLPLASSYMRRLVELAAVGCVLVSLAAMNAGAQSIVTVGMTPAASQPKPALELSDAQRQQVW